MRYFIPATRLLPPRIPHEVRRPRVCNLLFSRWQESPAVILAAPAGYGKSALLAPLAEVWVTLGEEARDPAVFVWHLLAAYRDRIPGQTVEARLMGGDWPGAARALAEALTTLPPHTLVLDEAHKAPAREGLSIIKALLNTPGLRLGLAGRRAAPWEALASVIGPEALAFDLEEALALARALAPSMAAFDVERAWRLVSGWPLGLRVLLRCAARGMLPERAVFEPPEPESISAYLLAGLEPEMATLAARAAAFTEVGPEEATRLGIEFEALETLAEDLLLERVGQRLRFHPLVRSALLRTLPSEEARSLVIRAAKHKGGIEAAVHLIEAGRYHEAAERLKAEGARWLEQGLNHSVLYLTERLTGHADLTLLRAEALRQAGRYADAEVLFLEAAKQGEAEALIGLARLYLDTVEPAKAWPHLRAARDQLPWTKVRPLWAENALNAGRIREALRLGAEGPRALLRSGRVEQALAAVRRLEETPPPRPSKNHREGRLLLALLEAIAGDAKAGLTAAEHARARGEDLGSPFVVALAEARRGHALLAMSRWEDAGVAYRQAMALSEGGPARLTVEALAGLGSLGDEWALEEALRLAEASGDAWVRAFISTMAAYARLRQGKGYPHAFPPTEDPFLTALARAYPWQPGDVGLLERHPFLLNATLFAPPIERSRHALWQAGMLKVDHHPGVCVEIQALGPFQVRVNGQPLRFKRAKARLLLALLVAGVEGKETLIEALEVSQGEFRVLWSELLHHLEPGRPPRSRGYFLAPYRLVPRPELRIDLWQSDVSPETQAESDREPFADLDHPRLDEARIAFKEKLRQRLINRGTVRSLLLAVKLDPLDEAPLEALENLGDSRAYREARERHERALRSLGLERADLGGLA